jgi:hypothetical protein
MRVGGRFVVALSVTAFALAGCGDDTRSEEYGSTTTSMTKTTPPATSSPSTTVLTSSRLSSLARHGLDFDRLGPVVVGMTAEEVAQAAGVELNEDRLRADDACVQLTPTDGTGVWLYSIDDRIAFISVTGDVRTVEGHGSGTSEADIVDAYGPDRAHAGDGGGGGRVVEVEPSEAGLDKYRLVFEFKNDGQSVTLMRAGRIPEVLERDEGCA